jgi:shikimate kinase
MGRSVAGRPLLSRPNPIAELERLLKERRSAYESADYVVDVERVAISEVVRRIVAAIRG